jgi:hypothetical protein
LQKSGHQGFVLKSIGDLDLAIADCAEAVYLDPGYAKAYHNGVSPLPPAPIAVRH